MALLAQMIENAERNILAAKQILLQLKVSHSTNPPKSSNASQIVEGVFDGENMIGMDGKKYPIPANYASKSKLIEGDLLKLTITEDDSFVYKQISPAERRKVIGTVMRDANGKYYINAEGRKYNVLLASITYFKAKKGDEVILVVPKEKISKWGAIEAVTDGLEKKAGNLAEKDKSDIAILEDSAKGEQNNNNKTSRKTKESNKAENIYQENNKKKTIEDEWTPDIEEIKKEAQFTQDREEIISDDLNS